ncbi:MAG: NUDIX domain-containing protein [Christensenellales bacterium]
MQDDQLRETFIDGQTLFEGRVITVETWRVRLPDGREAQREVVLHKGAAAIVPVDALGYVTLVRQHRVVPDRFTWEIPAGKLDYAGEDPLACAKRELEEETGLRAASWLKLNQVITTPGFCTEQIALYLARDLTQHEAHSDADEFLRIKKMPLEEAVLGVMNGEFPDAKTCLGILMAHHILAQRTHLPYGDGLQPLRRTARRPSGDARG